MKRCRLWAEEITLISETHASDEEYEAARTQFSEEDLVKLTMAVIAINGWNRLAIAFRPEVGNYQPAAKAASQTSEAARV